MGAPKQIKLSERFNLTYGLNMQNALNTVNLTSVPGRQVNGTSASDVWIAGADDGHGPVVLHFDGNDWQRRETGVKGE